MNNLAAAMRLLDDTIHNWNSGRQERVWGIQRIRDIRDRAMPSIAKELTAALDFLENGESADLHHANDLISLSGELATVDEESVKSTLV